MDSPIKRKFLGYTFYYTKTGVKFRVHEKSYRRFKKKIKEITNRNISMNFRYRLKRLNQITVGWINYYKLANMKNKLKEIEE
ncbi:group II intron maturase-specific domain-containing protein [Abyssisolibacter fermentans]|uniref:group II intron maturase-specific domain-containing protein n=1 Tax=Abyssisolibacter fermentans TaxID=1766203 RepID=UPI00192E5A79|nr:group II intron maturase-specific domain-containing protein [Abyssisolibacter fermentans]